MRTLTRLHACFAAGIVFLLYLSWLRPARLTHKLESVWKKPVHRVVVFGDDWSDVGEYRAGAPPSGTTQDRHPSRGSLWVEALCEELGCDVLDNFARSVPLNVRAETVGSVIDAHVFANATTGQANDKNLLFDFQTQVQQYLAYEKTRKLQPSKFKKLDDWVIFTVYFGIWDLWEYSALEEEAAKDAVDRSVQELTHNLEILADHVESPFSFVVPRLVDVTFLPRYSNDKDESAIAFAEKQHRTVYLWSYWNLAVSRAMHAWKKSELFMPDFHNIVMDQFRAKQLYSQNITDAQGHGKEKPLFDIVEQPCLSPKTGDAGSELQATSQEICSDPAAHLFWDEMHLSGPAHELIGKEAARLVRENNIVNHDAREQAKLNLPFGTPRGGQSMGQNHRLDFHLKLPPGHD